MTTTVTRPARPTGFDVVLGNPPWLSYTGRQKVAIPRQQLALFVGRFPAIRRWPCSHSAFLLLQADLLQDGGRCGLVLPRQIADLDSFEPVRASVCSDCGLIGEIHDAGEDSFPGVTQPVGLYCFGHGSALTHQSPGQWPVAFVESDDTSGGQDHDGGAILGDELRALLNRCRDLPPFPPKTFSDPGVHTGNVSKKIILNDPDAEVSQGCLEPVREGKNISAFHAGPARKWVWLDADLADGEYCRIRERNRYTNTPILLRQTANRPIGARHSDPTYFRNSLLACHGMASVSISVMLALLNSTLYAFLHRARFIDSGQKAFPQVKIKHLHLLPAAPPSLLSGSSEGILHQVEDLVAQIESTASSGPIPQDLLDALDALVLQAFGFQEALLPLMKEAIS